MNNCYHIENEQFTSNLIEIGLIYDNSEYFDELQSKKNEGLKDKIQQLFSVKSQREELPTIDIDFSSALINSSKKLINKDYFVFYGSEITGEFLNEQGKRPISYDRSLFGIYSDDLQQILSPEYDGTIHLFTDRINNEIDEIKIFVTIFPGGQGNFDGKEKFGSKCNFSITLLDYYTKKSLFHFKYNFGFEGTDTIELGTFLRNDGKWTFYAYGKYDNGAMKKIIETYL